MVSRTKASGKGEKKDGSHVSWMINDRSQLHEQVKGEKQVQRWRETSQISWKRYKLEDREA
jgi:hypothetical protein